MSKAGRIRFPFLALIALAALGLAAFGSVTTARSSSQRPSPTKRSLGTTRASSGRVMVLGYHAIADLRDDPILHRYSVPPQRFVEQLDLLARRGWTFVDLDAVLVALQGGRQLPRRAVLLTFDDAYRDLLEVAAPILEERGIPAVVFAVAGKLGGRNDWDCEKGATELELLDGDGLRELAQRNIEVGAHTTTHQPLPRVSPQQLGDEVAGAADRLEAVGLPRPRAFSYPYGEWDRRVASAVSEAGFEVAFTTDWGVVREGAQRHALPRLAVHAEDSASKLHLKLATARWRWALRSLRRS